MKLWISGELQDDIANDFRAVRKEVEHTVNEVLETRSYGAGLVQWAFIAMIFGDKGPVEYKEVKRYSKREKVAEFRLKVDYMQFKRGDNSEKTKLLCEALLTSLELMQAMSIPDVDVSAIRAEFLAVATAEGWLK